MLAAIRPLLPTELQSAVDSLDTKSSETLDNVLNFALDPSNNSSVRSAAKRARETNNNDDRNGVAVDGNAERPAKRLRTDDNEPRFTLHALSASAPVRKKVDITLGTRAFTLRNASTNAVEAELPLSEASRAFVLPTPDRPKAKPHWTVVIIPNSSSWEQNQVIFGVDALMPLKSTDHAAGSKSSFNEKGTPSKPMIQSLLAEVPGIFMFEPDEKACVAGYRRAKDGHLWLLPGGLLWGEKKPCEFFAASALSNARTLTATGRSFSLFLDLRTGEEAEISMIDGKDNDQVQSWIEKNRKSFVEAHDELEDDDAPPIASTSAPAVVSEGAEKPQEAEVIAESDASDDDFVGDDSEDLSDGSGSSSEEDDDDEAQEEDVPDNDDAKDGSGYESDDNASLPGDMDEAKHPLLRADKLMPRVSTTAAEMAIDSLGLPATPIDVDEDDELAE